jgi:integrase
MRDYRSTVKAHLREAFVKDADAVTADDVRELRAGLEAKGLATRTVAKTLVVAHGILAFAGVEPNPVAEAKPQERRTKARRAAKAAQEGAPPFFTGAEVATLIGQAPTERRADMISFAAQTGLRWGEIVGLRWGHVGGAWLEVQASYDKSGVTGPPKSGRERSVPLGQEAAAVLDRQHKLVPHEVGDLVFPHEDGGHERMDVSSSRGWFRALLNHTGLYVNQRGVHGLRHTFGTFGAHMVLPLTLQEWMGHADFTTTARYLHRVPPDTAPPDGFGEGWPVVLPPWLEGVQRAVQRTPLKST